MPRRFEGIRKIIIHFAMTESLSLIGISGDCITTRIGLDQGFYESHPQFNPLIAISIFTVVNLLLIFLGTEKKWLMVRYAFAFLSWAGFLSNLLFLRHLF